MAKQYDVLFRLLLLGDSGVGKTCMLRRFTEGEFDPSHISTIGVDFKMKTIEIDGLKVRIQIWDTAGQERYQTITKQYYRRAQHIAKWASDVDEFAPDDVQTVLVGNKADEEFDRQVTKDQGKKLAETYGMEFFETSASTSSNISESFIRVTELVLQAQMRYVDDLLGSLDNYLDRVALREEKGSQDNDAQRTCAC
ncbi:ras-related protein Rab-15-like isoform X2 [Xiphophorus couchianus]|uniref:ras-related protein Rab-15-like isoform X2 n=1 Tax=Xiphophorus couchianus TaxID=32473 RepID=UPI001015FFA3|nr:ras-related protein Rab-15-like isoform X2 [Xiphophorus couchianus]